MSADASKMEEVINKPDEQFKATLRDLVDFGKGKIDSPLIKELYRTSEHNHHIKPAASINSSSYSSAASSSSSSSNSSTNSTSSTSSTLSSPSQSNLTNSKSSNDREQDNPSIADNNELGEIEMAILEDQGKKATILEHRSSEINNIRRSVAAGPALFYQDSSITYKPSLDTIRMRSATQNPISTNQKNLLARKKRPIEQPIFSEHIPGHRGEQEVECLVQYIQVSLAKMRIFRCQIK